MATAQELKNEARELLAKAEQSLQAGDQATYKTLFDAFTAKDAEHLEAAKREDELKQALEKYKPSINDIRRPEDALIPSVKPEDAKSGVMVNNGEVIPFATKDSEGYIKGYPAAVQHPGIIKRYGPELRAESMRYTEAFMKWVRKGRTGLSDTELKALQEGTDSEGGYLVPTDQVKLPYIHDSGVQGGTIRPRASVYQTSRDAGNWPTVGSVLWASVAEEAALPATTDPVFGSVAFSIKKIMGMHKVAQELLEDSAVDIGGIINKLYTESLGRWEDQQFIEGDGTTEPEGIRTSGGTDASGSAIWDASDGVTAAQVINTFFQLQANFRQSAVWHTTSTHAARIYAAGSAAAGIHFLPDPATGAPTLTLLGKPVICFDGTGWDTTLSGTNEYGCFGDFSNYYIIDRVGMSIRRLNELYAGNDQVGFVARVRLDGVVALDTAFLIMKGQA